MKSSELLWMTDMKSKYSSYFSGS